MEYLKMKNVLDDTTNKLPKFETRDWVEINDEVPGTYNESNQIKLKISIIRSDLCDYSNAYIHFK